LFLAGISPKIARVMHLSPRELDKLVLHQAGFVAQKRLARGTRLNHPESVALIATVLLEFIRDGRTVADLMDLGRKFLGRNQVMPGVPEMIEDVQVEGTFPDGSKLVTVHHPIAALNGDLALALYGSFLPVPSVTLFQTVDDARNPPLPSRRGEGEGVSDFEGGKPPVHGAPGAFEIREGDIELNANRPVVSMRVTNLGDRPIQVGSHYHFIETNAALRFDRAKAYGMRLAIPAGTAVRFEPGETKTVKLVGIGGKKIIRGGNNLASGKVSAPGKRAALKLVAKKGFASQE
jgi:urease subunit gamma/beta